MCGAVGSVLSEQLTCGVLLTAKTVYVPPEGHVGIELLAFNTMYGVKSAFAGAGAPAVCPVSNAH